MRSYTLSFEFFPPKEEQGEKILFETAEELKLFAPDFVSVTYGAGGSTRDKTLKWTKTLREKYKNAVMHLTCYGNTPTSITDTCRALSETGISSVLALRGDPVNNPHDISTAAFPNALGLIKHIKTSYPNFDITVAGYPEKHPQALDLKSDIVHLKEKVDAGGDSVITQLFFDNSFFFRFLELTQKAGIEIPIIAGIMPITNFSQLKKFTSVCGASIPQKLYEKLEKASPEDVANIGVDEALSQVSELIRQGVSGLHFYTLNKYLGVKQILQQL